MAEGNVREAVSEVVSKAKRRVGAESPSAADADGNVGIVRGAMRAFGEGDMDGFLDALKEDVEWEAPAGKHFPGGGDQSGREAVKTKFVADAGRTYSSFGFRPESFFDADEDDAVLVLGRFVGEGVEGANVDTPAVQVWEMKGNAVARVLIVADSAAFPKVITEKDEKEKEQKEKEEKEEGGSADTEAEGNQSGGEESKDRDDNHKSQPENRGESNDRDDENKSEPENRGEAKRSEQETKSEGRDAEKSG